MQHFSRYLMCPTSGISYDEPQPNLFSFNSPYGACHKCNGLGEVSEIDINKIIPNKKLSLKKGAILPIGEFKNNWIFKQLESPWVCWRLSGSLDGYAGAWGQAQGTAPPPAPMVHVAAPVVSVKLPELDRLVEDG